MAKPVAERVKASRIRSKAAQGIPLSDDEAANLETYEETLPPAKNRSATSRVIHLDIDEQAAAEGNHPHPEMYAAAVRSEGLRADTLMNIFGNRMMQCNDQYMKLMVHMMERSTRLEDAHVALLEAVREHFLARTDAEAALRMERSINNASGDDDEMAEMLKLLLMAKANNDADPEKKKKVKRMRKKPLGSVD